MYDPMFHDAVMCAWPRVSPVQLGHKPHDIIQSIIRGTENKETHPPSGSDGCTEHHLLRNQQRKREEQTSTETRNSGCETIPEQAARR